MLEKIDVTALIKLASRKELKEKTTKMPFKTFKKESFVKNLQNFIFVSDDSIWGITEIENLEFSDDMYEPISKNDLKVVRNGEGTELYVRKGSKRNNFGFPKNIVDKLLELTNNENMFGYPKRQIPMMLRLSQNNSKKYCVIICDCKVSL